MSTVYDYVMAVWLHIELPQPSAEFEDELREHLLQTGFQVNKLEILGEDEVRSNGDCQVSLQIQLTLDESQMDGDEPAAEAVAEFDEELRTCLSSKYEVAYLDVLDDSPHSCLLGEREDPRRGNTPSRSSVTDRG